MALLSDLNCLIECRNLPQVTLSDPHQAVWLKLHLGICPQKAGKHNVLSPKIYMKSIDLQLVPSLLTAVNWRNIFADDRHVYDYVTSFMHVFNNVIQQSSFKSPVHNSKPRESYPNIYDNFFSKNIVLRKRFTIKAALLTTGL